MDTLLTKANAKMRKLLTKYTIWEIDKEEYLRIIEILLDKKHKDIKKIEYDFSNNTNIDKYIQPRYTTVKEVLENDLKDN